MEMDMVAAEQLMHLTMSGGGEDGGDRCVCRNNIYYQGRYDVQGDQESKNQKEKKERKEKEEFIIYAIEDGPAEDILENVTYQVQLILGSIQLIFVFLFEFCSIFPYN